MGSPEKPMEVELQDMDQNGLNSAQKIDISEAAPLNAEVSIKMNEANQSDEFVGLQKEELMAIADQPKWKRARMVLFLLFWASWIAMLVAAIMVVYNAPKCKPLPTTEWYQNTVFYKVDPAHLASDYKGLIANMKYVRDLKSSLLLSNVMGPDMKTPLNDAASFDELVKTAHNNDIKVVVELQVDSLATSSEAFKQSSAASCNQTAGQVCEMFKWSSANGSAFMKNPTASGRLESYEGTATNAVINYNSKYSQNYLTESLDLWIKRGVDGFLLNDLSKITSTAEKVAEVAWTKLNPSKALFLDASDPTLSVKLSEVYSITNGSIGVPNPVVLHRTPTKGVDFKQQVLQVTNKTRNFPAFIRPATAIKDFNQSLALTLVNIALPGVSMIHSGEELANTSYSNLVWKKNKPEIAEKQPTKFALSTTQDAIKKKVADTISKHSLRYYTHDQDTKFEFLHTSSPDVVAFCRKWGKKSPVIVLSNFAAASVSNFTVDFQSCDKEMVEPTILVSSNNYNSTFKAGSSLNLKSIYSITPYTTVILGV